MHKVLFIAYDFPPCPSIGGSLRSEKFVKYLPEFGWEATILSLSQCSSGVKEKYSHVNRVRSLTPFSRPYEVAPYGWLLPLYQKGRNLLRSNKYDLIYVSCPPFPQTIAAAKLKKSACMPLVMDFRDAWSLDPYTEGSRLKKVLYRILFPTMEKMVLSCTDCLIVNTPSAFEAYLKKYPILSGRIHMIPNGYDEQDFTEYRPVASGKQMKILYMGRFAVGARDPLPLLKAFRLLIDHHLPVRLHIIGNNRPVLSKLVEELGLNNHVRLSGQIPHKNAIKAMANFDVLLLYQQQSMAVITPIAGKTYEYLRAGKAILAILPPGDNLNIIHKYAARQVTVTDHNENQIFKGFLALYQDWKRGNLPLYMPPADHFEKYSRQNIAACLTSVFDDIVKQGATYENY
jgi:glycosyltransferase involved in cell wall biosynthesis